MSDSSLSDSENEDFYEENNARYGGLLWQTSSSDSSEEDIFQIRNARHFRPRENHMDKWNEEEFVMRFRLRKNTVRHLLNLIEVNLRRETRRNNAIQPMDQLLLVLRFYATGCMLTTAGDFSGVHKSTASQIVKVVTNAVASLSGQYITMPSNEEEKQRTHEQFYGIARFPQVVGAIDCTHIKIQSPEGENAENFRNRKGYFSLNFQAICNSNLKFCDIVERWQGSQHDQTIFSYSQIHGRFEAGEFGNSVLLGDSGYGLKNYLLTPIANPANVAENLYNESHIRTRNVIERVFGVWKRRFPILSLGIRLSIGTTQAVIIACAVLHNIARDMLENEPPEDPNIRIEVDEIINEPAINPNNNARQKFVNYFENLL